MFEQKLRPQGLNLKQGELGDLVEKEMAATSAAVESAAARIEAFNSLLVLPYKQMLGRILVHSKQLMMLISVCRFS